VTPWLASRGHVCYGWLAVSMFVMADGGFGGLVSDRVFGWRRTCQGL
jgi:hypothetical protein